MPQSLVIGEHAIPSGTRQTVHLPLPYFYTHAPTTMPIHVVRGKQAGPCLLVTSALHGDEINGIEIIRRVLISKTLDHLKGTLLLVPVVNVFGFVGQSRYLPDRRDLNRSFPGSPKGSMAARLANLLVSELLPSSTHVIDIHTAAIGRENLPQIRGCFNMGGRLAAMANAFNAPVLLDLGLRSGTFREAAHKLDIPCLVYEAGEALRFDEISIRAGVSGIFNVLAHLGMIRKRSRRKGPHPLVAKSTQWIRAPQSGVLRTLVPLGARVAQGETLAFIGDPFGGNEETIASSASGIVIGRSRIPLVHEGEAVFHIARFDQPSEAAQTIGLFQDAFDPVGGTSDSEEPPLV